MVGTFRRPTLDDYGLIGNLHTAALVSRFGSIDWACLPRFASPSVFARILDPERGGFQLVHPTVPCRSHQEYRPSSCILDTTFDLAGGGRLTVSDGMPVVPGLKPEGAPMILREVMAHRRSVPIEVRFAPRFGYAVRIPRLRRVPGGIEGLAGEERLRCTLALPFTIEDGSAVARGTLAAGARLEIEIYWGRRRPVTTAFPTLLDGTDRFWSSWAHHPDAPFHRSTGQLHRWVERSELTLKLLSHADTGAFVAAPTTSIPEWPGGTRNWDYRYVWIRDAAFTGSAMLRLGHEAEARAFLRWALLRLHDDPEGRLRVVYGAHGESDLAEHELPHLRGLWDSRPVRIGNGAARQFQLDIYGELLDAALLLERVDPSFLVDQADALARLADQVVALWRRPDRGIWEIRGPPRHYVHSKVMAWVALDRANRLAQSGSIGRPSPAWEPELERIRSWILSEGYDPERRSFRQAQDSTETDAANLRIPLVGFLPADDPRVEGTVRRVRREISRGPFVYRYRAPDGIAGKEGAFLATSFWMVECLARGGRVREARAAWDRLIECANPLGLFSEEFDPVRHRRLGNFPQALTHIALLRAASALGKPAPTARSVPGSSTRSRRSGARIRRRARR